MKQGHRGVREKEEKGSFVQRRYINAMNSEPGKKRIPEFDVAGGILWSDGKRSDAI